MGRGLIRGTIWKMLCHNLFINAKFIVVDLTHNMHWDTTIRITSIDGKNFTSSENLFDGVILSVHSSREVDAGSGCWWSQINYYKFGICSVC
jgi:hypothetical protein